MAGERQAEIISLRPEGQEYVNGFAVPLGPLPLQRLLEQASREEKAAVVSTPNPGSEEALALFCICPIVDKHQGEGVNGEFWITAGCPVHDPKSGDVR